MQLIKKIKASNILSFGPESEGLGLDLKLRNLNVLIGANGSGKSNLIELFSLLRATPRSSEDTSSNLPRTISRGGGTQEWIWKGNPGQEATIETILDNPYGNQDNLRHLLSFESENQRFRIADELVENEFPYGKEKHPYFYYKYQRGNPVVNVNSGSRELKRESVENDFSILAQRRDPDTYPELHFVGSSYEKIRIYREWSFGRNTIFREPQKADLRNDRLEEDFSNLGLYLNRLGKSPIVKKAMIENLRNLYSGLEGYDVSIDSGSVQVFFTENNFYIPATRLSDGSLRYLCLLSILLDPTPPPMICIEEPELGLHPDLIPKIADLLKSAAERTQIIVTTHSEFLIDAMTDRPEDVLVCEKQDGITTITRLDTENLSSWLERYRLGQLWTMGEIGGTRW
jgi:predicted ATPase